MTERGEAGLSRSVPGARPTDLISASFDATQITVLRHDVTDCAASAGLFGQPLEDFVLAVNELVTNAVRHGGGQGFLRLWRADDQLVCEVADQGAGIAVGGANGRVRPAVHVEGGWGMWLARELTKTMHVTSGPEGTSVRISADVTPQRAAGGPAGRDGATPGPDGYGRPTPPLSTAE
jgi:serine/threonine-protein kinase RsbW